MFYLAMTVRFSHSDLLDMDHTDRIRWVQMASKFNQDQNRQFSKIPRK